MTHQQAVETLAAERYLLDEMPADERGAFEEHFFGCEVCADEMRTAAAMLQGTRTGFAVASAAPRRHFMFRSVALSWVAAAVLAVIAGYQAWWVIPALRRTEATALLPVTLHPASRGAEPVVPLDRDANAVTLAVDGIESGNRTVTWTLTTADGRILTSKDAPTPPPGAPLLLLIPSWTLTGGMHYILAFRDGPDAGRSLGEYRFAVSAR